VWESRFGGLGMTISAGNHSKSGLLVSLRAEQPQRPTRGSYKITGNKRSPLERGNGEVIEISGNVWGVFFCIYNHTPTAHTPAGEHRQRSWRIYPSQEGTGEAQKECIKAGLCYKLRRTMMVLYFFRFCFASFTIFFLSPFSLR